MKDKIFLYADKDSPVSDDIPSISMPYKDVKQFRRENPDLKMWKSYSLRQLLEAWGFDDKIKAIEDLEKEVKKFKAKAHEGRELALKIQDRETELKKEIIVLRDEIHKLKNRKER